MIVFVIEVSLILLYCLSQY